MSAKANVNEVIIILYELKLSAFTSGKQSIKAGLYVVCRNLIKAGEAQLSPRLLGGSAQFSVSARQMLQSKGDSPRRD